MRITKKQLRKIIREAVINETLPPHLKKHFNKDGSAKVHNPMGYEIRDVTPAGYGPGEANPEPKFSRKFYEDGTLTTPEDFKSLHPGDNLSLNGKPIVVIGVSPMTGEVDYVDRGKATRKYFDYRMALVDEPGEMPEYDVVYLGPGEPPQNTRLPRR